MTRKQATHFDKDNMAQSSSFHDHHLIPIRGIVIGLFLFAILIGLDDVYYRRSSSSRNSFSSTATTTTAAAAENDDDTIDHDPTNNALRSSSTMSPHLPHPHPHMGYKLQINTSAFTVNDYECVQLDTGTWPSERVHCELLRSTTNDDTTDDDTKNDDTANYVIVVEHFDDIHCTKSNPTNPRVHHAAAGCYYFEQYNHSYNDVCHSNRTLTLSAFYGPGCVVPMPVTALNLLPEDYKE